MLPGLSRPAQCKSLPVENQGAAILIFITILLLAATTFLVTEISVNQGSAQRQINNAELLGQGKEALLGYALTHATPGTLPCPDSTGDGLENPAGAGCQRQLGLLPSRTLNLPPLTDESGARLWYAVSTNLVANAAVQKNSSSLANLLLDGRPAVALVIAPGESVNGQDRRLLVTADFLEGLNADANPNDFESIASDNNNDQIVSLFPGPFWSMVERRVLGESAQLLRTYRVTCGELPWAANFGGPFDSVGAQQAGAPPFATALPTDWGAPCAGGNAPIPAAWLVNHWSDQLYYAMCQAAEGTCLNLIGNVPPNVIGVMLAPGIALGAQNRPDIAVSDYYEAENNSAPANQFRRRALINHSDVYNDLSVGL